MTKQFIDLGNRILDEGVWVENERTGKRCLTVINADLVYDVGKGEFPLASTRVSYWKPALAELLGYWRGYNNAEDFEAIGTKTWNKNSQAESWLTSPYRVISTELALDNEDIDAKYMGRVYGVQGIDWRIPEAFVSDVGEFPVKSVNQLKKIIDNLTAGIDDRGEILMFWNPGELHLGCLRPCMYSYHFSILGDTLHLNATQRSCDVPLGLNFNMVQVFTFLAIMARITGLKPGKAYHKIVNAHIYEDQLELMRDVQLKRTPDAPATLILPDDLKTAEDVETWLSPENFKVTNYNPQEAIDYPFTT